MSLNKRWSILIYIHACFVNLSSYLSGGSYLIYAIICGLYSQASTRQLYCEQAFTTHDGEQLAVICSCFDMDFKQSGFFLYNVMEFLLVFFYFTHMFSTIWYYGWVSDAQFPCFVCEILQVFWRQGYRGTTFYDERFLWSSKIFVISNGWKKFIFSPLWLTRASVGVDLHAGKG